MAAVSYICRSIRLNIIKRNIRLVSQSSSKSAQKKVSEQMSSTPDFSKPLENKNWVSYGFSKDDYVQDRYLTHVSLFFAFTITICGVSFLVWFYPDRKEYDWARREAYIRLYERERLGLPAIDKNYIDPALIQLPPDEEIGPDDIII